MTRRVASFWPQRVNNWFNHAVIGSFGADGSPDIAVMDIGVLNALDGDGILAANSIATADMTTTFASTYTGSLAQWGMYGRNVTVRASGAATTFVRVQGRDYMGQPMTEALTLNGTTTVQGVKAFRYIDRVNWEATAATTIDVGWGNYLGVPYRCLSMVAEVKNNTAAANAGALTSGLPVTSTAGATNADPRGLYLPSTVIPNGSVNFVIRCIVDKTHLYGVQHYFTLLT
jgi:hypothetical protein